MADHIEAGGSGVLRALLHDAIVPARDRPDPDVDRWWREGRRDRRTAHRRRVAVCAVALLLAVVAAGTVATWPAPDSTVVAGRPPGTGASQGTAGGAPAPAAVAPAPEPTGTDPEPTVPNDAAARIVGRIRIPAIDLDVSVHEGTTLDDLRDGPMWIRWPAPASTVVLFGHRTTFSGPFRRIDELVPGDQIILTLQTGTSWMTTTYRVDPDGGSGLGHRILPPGGGPFGLPDVLPATPAQRAGPRLLLASYHPSYSSAQRIVVEASADASTSDG